MASATYLRLVREKDDLLIRIEALIRQENKFGHEQFNEKSTTLTREVTQFTQGVKANYNKLEKSEQQQVTDMVQELQKGIIQLGEIALRKQLSIGEDLDVLSKKADNLKMGATLFEKKGLYEKMSG